MTDEPGGARHDLLWLTEAGWASVQTVTDTSSIRVWAAHRLPVMRRRPQPDDEPGAIPVAIAMPPAHGRARLSFHVTPTDVVRFERPPSLRAVLPGLPPSLLSRAEDVLARADGIGFAPRVFGSAMWQHITGLSYLHDRSDLDLLWEVTDIVAPASLVARLVQMLAQIEAGAADPRLDGEIVLGRGAVQWRELLPTNDTLLVKTGTGVTLMRRSTFFEAAPAPC